MCAIYSFDVEIKEESSKVADMLARTVSAGRFQARRRPRLTVTSFFAGPQYLVCGCRDGEEIR